jgi:hypothetical protein
VPALDRAAGIAHNTCVSARLAPGIGRLRDPSARKGVAHVWHREIGFLLVLAPLALAQALSSCAGSRPAQTPPVAKSAAPPVASASAPAVASSVPSGCESRFPPGIPVGSPRPVTPCDLRPAHTTPAGLRFGSGLPGGPPVDPGLRDGETTDVQVDMEFEPLPDYANPFRRGPRVMMVLPRICDDEAAEKSGQCRIASWCGLQGKWGKVVARSEVFAQVDSVIRRSSLGLRMRECFCAIGKENWHVSGSVRTTFEVAVGATEPTNVRIDSWTGAGRAVAGCIVAAHRKLRFEPLEYGLNVQSRLLFRR